MKASEIVEGATYERNGDRRFVQYASEVSQAVDYITVKGAGKRKGSCRLSSFARWAKRRVEQDERP